MKKLIYNFITGLTDLSRRYNFEGKIDIELSSTTFELNTYYTEFHINKEVNKITAQDILNIREDMKKLLQDTFTENFEYVFNVTTKDGKILPIFEDKYEPSIYSTSYQAIEFPNNNIEETPEQYYSLILKNGKLTLEHQQSRTDEYFKSNPEIINYLNSFIDNKIPKTIIPTSKEI